MFTVLWKLRWFFKNNWRSYTIALVFLIIAGGFEILPPKILGYAIDEIQSKSLTWHRLWMYILAIGAVGVITYFITYIWMSKLFSGAYKLERTLRSRLMRHLFKMTPAFYERNRTGDLMARATNDLKAVSITAGFGILTLTDSTVFLLTILLTMGFTISWPLTLAAIIPLPFMAILVGVGGKVIHKRFTVAQNSFGLLNDKVLESVSGVRVIRAYVQERADENRFKAMTDDVYRKNMAVVIVESFFEPLVKVLTGLSYLIGLGYGIYLVIHQKITVGDLVSFNVYLGMLNWPMFAIGELMNIMQRGNASLDRVDETLSEEEDVKNPSNPVNVENPKDIKFHSFAFQYPSSKMNNLADIKLTLHQGETLGIVGKTGSGKTTFVRQLLREYHADTGLEIADIDINDQKKEQVRDWIGYVPQDHVLFSRTVKENLLFGKSDASEQDIQKAIKLAAFEQDLERLPDGLQTLVGEKGVALSGGQKQRISIARALLKEPEILILDDSLSAVDAKTETMIIDNLAEVRKEKTTIITTHRLSAVEHADTIIVLSHGRIVQRGTHETLITQPGWYQEQYLRQQMNQEKTEEVST